MNDNQLIKLLAGKETPFYAFDLDRLRRRIQALRKALPDHIHLCYAVKANTFILKEMSGLVERFEICSPGELRICQKLQLPPEKFVISGVYKDPSLMSRLISGQDRIGIYTVESRMQFSILHEAATAAKRKIPVLLRLTSGNQFGLDTTEIEEILADYKDSTYLEIRGIQYFSGTQKTSVKRLKKELAFLDLFLNSLRDKYDYQAKELEFGPGLPISYFEGESFDEECFLQQFSQLVDDMEFCGAITIELGRSIAASCGKYFTRIVDLKRNNGENYAIVDGGMHQLVYYGQFMAMKHPCVRQFPCRAEGKAQEEWNICGSLCTANDILVKKIPLKNLQIGDVLIFENTGAYCITEGISLFLSRDLPEVVLIKENGTILTVRERVQTELLNTPLY